MFSLGIYSIESANVGKLYEIRNHQEPRAIESFYVFDVHGGRIMDRVCLVSYGTVCMVLKHYKTLTKVLVGEDIINLHHCLEEIELYPVT